MSALLVAAMLQHTIIACPYCGYRKRVTHKPVARRVCPRCRKYFQDPLAK